MMVYIVEKPEILLFQRRQIRNETVFSSISDIIRYSSGGIVERMILLWPL